MSNGILQDSQKEKCLIKVQDHLPTSSTNENLIKLSVVGTNVFESEKAYALQLIQQNEISRGGHFKKFESSKNSNK